jgi:hypothetical protein
MKVQGGYTGGGGPRPPVPTTGSGVKPPDVPMSATEALSYFEGFNDAIKSCSDVERAALVKRVCDLELQADLQSRLRARSAAVLRDAEVRITIMSRGIDELFAIKRHLAEARALLQSGRRYAHNCISGSGYDSGMPEGFQSRAEVWLADVDFLLSKEAT